MAAPTNFRVEAIGQNTTFLRWSYAGTTGVGIYRSTDGVAYTLINPSTVPAGTAIYIDTTASSGTKYWYKLSDDAGVTFSDIKTVKTHVCKDDAASKKKGFHLPRFSPLTKTIPIGHRGIDTKDSELNNKEVPIFHSKLGKAMRDIEDVVKKHVLHQEPCEVCIVDNAIIINCADGCDCYNVEANTDINSISFVNCEGVDPCIHFKVPPGTTVGICGWPQGHNAFATQFSGDECTETPVEGGTEGRTVTTGGTPPTSKPGSGKGGGSGGGSGCECLASNTGQLQVKCCSDDCTLDCSDTKSLELKICGGTPPYNIESVASGLQFKNRGGYTVSTEIPAGTVIVVTPPENTGSGVSGVAYYRCFRGQIAAEPCACENCRCEHGCDDGSLVACSATSSECTTPQPVIYLVTTSFPECTHGTSGGIPDCRPADPGTVLGTCAAGHGASTKGGTITDKRTAQMITDGCNPCALHASGAVVTVTDAEGVAVLKTIEV